MEGAQKAWIGDPVLLLYWLRAFRSEVLTLTSISITWRVGGRACYPSDRPPHPSRVSDPVGMGWGGESAFLTGSQMVVGAADLGPKSLVAFQTVFETVRTPADSRSMN